MPTFIIHERRELFFLSGLWEKNMAASFSFKKTSF